MSVFCKSCNVFQPEDSRWCPDCGAILPEKTSELSTFSESQPNAVSESDDS